jgi:hypothetical protein
MSNDEPHYTRLKSPYYRVRSEEEVIRHTVSAKNQPDRLVEIEKSKT